MSKSKIQYFDGMEYTTEIVCHYCKQNPGDDANGNWKGFRDMDYYDTMMVVCWKCRTHHYCEKSKDPEKINRYSEMPVFKGWFYNN